MAFHAVFNISCNINTENIIGRNLMSGRMTSAKPTTIAAYVFALIDALDEEALDGTSILAPVLTDGLPKYDPMERIPAEKVSELFNAAIAASGDEHFGLKVDEYIGSTLCYADFDASIPAITNEVAFTQQDFNRLIWYTSFSPDDKRILYTDTGKVFEYDIETATHRKVSTDDSLEYRYPSYLGSVK